MRESISKKIIEERNKNYEMHYKKFDCNHENTEIRKRLIKNDLVQYVYQCTRCGYPASQAIAKEKAISINNGKEPVIFDKDLAGSWTKSREDSFKKIEIDYKEKEEAYAEDFWKKYDIYLKTEKWKKIREKVILRAQGICEGCREEKAVSPKSTG